MVAHDLVHGSPLSNFKLSSGFENCQCVLVPSPRQTHNCISSFSLTATRLSTDDSVAHRQVLPGTHPGHVSYLDHPVLSHCNRPSPRPRAHHQPRKKVTSPTE